MFSLLYSNTKDSTWIIFFLNSSAFFFSIKRQFCGKRKTFLSTEFCLLLISMARAPRRKEYAPRAYRFFSADIKEKKKKFANAGRSRESFITIFFLLFKIFCAFACFFFFANRVIALFWLLIPTLNFLKMENGIVESLWEGNI